MKKNISILLTLVGFLFAASAVSADEALFKNKKCDKCHATKGPDAKLDKKGSNLAKVGSRHDAAWLDSFMKDPEKVRKSDAKAAEESKKFKKAMSKPKLNDDERAKLVQYMSGLK